MNEAAKRYFDEVALQLRKRGFETLPPEDGILPVNWRGMFLCHVTTAGGLRYKGDNPVDGTADQMRNQVYGIARANTAVRCGDAGDCSKYWSLLRSRSGLIREAGRFFPRGMIVVL